MYNLIQINPRPQFGAFLSFRLSCIVHREQLRKTLSLRWVPRILMISKSYYRKNSRISDWCLRRSLAFHCSVSNLQGATSWRGSDAESFRLLQRFGVLVILSGWYGTVSRYCVFSWVKLESGTQRIREDFASFATGGMCKSTVGTWLLFLESFNKWVYSACQRIWHTSGETHS